MIAPGEAITHTQHLEEARSAWKEAESLIEKIKDAGWRMERLSQLATALVEAREWERSEAILGLLWMGNPSHGTRESLSQLAEVLIEARDWERPEAILSIVISRGSTYDHTASVDKLIKILIQEQGIDRICDKAKPYVEIGPASYEAFSWGDAFLMA